MGETEDGTQDSASWISTLYYELYSAPSGSCFIYLHTHLLCFVETRSLYIYLVRTYNVDEAGVKLTEIHLPLLLNTGVKVVYHQVQPLFSSEVHVHVWACVSLRSSGDGP